MTSMPQGSFSLPQKSTFPDQLIHVQDPFFDVLGEFDDVVCDPDEGLSGRRHGTPIGYVRGKAVLDEYAPKPRGLSEMGVGQRQDPKLSLPNRAKPSTADQARERNRQAQIRYRTKRKEEMEELQGHLTQVAAKIKAARQHFSSLKMQKAEHAARLAVAKDAYIAVAQVRLAATPESPQQPSLPSQVHPQASPFPVPRRHLAPEPSLYRTFSSSPALPRTPSARPPSPCPPSPSPPFRPISCFARVAPLSLDACRPFCPLSSHADGGLLMTEAVRHAKAAACQPHLVGASASPQDTCWFLQTSYAARPGEALSFSSTLSSVPCVLSLFLFYIATTLEATLLTHVDLGTRSYFHSDSQHADSSSDSMSTCIASAGQQSSEATVAALQHRGSGLQQCLQSRVFLEGPAPARQLRSSLSSPAPHSMPPAQPPGPHAPPAATASSFFGRSQADSPEMDAAAPSGFAVTCGVNESCDGSAAVSAVLRGVLSEYVHRLTHEAFVSCCSQFLRSLSRLSRLNWHGSAQGPPTTTGSLAKRQRFNVERVPSLDGSKQGQLDTPAEEAWWEHSPEEVAQRTAALFQTASDCVAAALHSASRGGQMLQQASDRQRWPDAAGRHEAVSDAWGFCWACVVADGQRTARTVMGNSECLGRCGSRITEVSQQHAVAFKSLGLSDEQVSLLAAAWDQWGRHRLSLDCEMAAVRERLRVLPSPACLDSRLLSLVSARAAPAGPLPSARTTPGTFAQHLDGSAGFSSAMPLDLSAPMALHSGSPLALASSVLDGWAGPGTSAGLGPLQCALPSALLGMSAGATRDAAALLDMMVDMHLRDARLFDNAVASFALQGAGVLTGPQRSRLRCMHVLHDCPPMEMLTVCQIAATQQRRQELFAQNMTF